MFIQMFKAMIMSMEMQTRGNDVSVLLDKDRECTPL